MTNSRGFNDQFPISAYFAEYDSFNGEFTGTWWESYPTDYIETEQYWIEEISTEKVD